MSESVLYQQKIVGGDTWSLVLKRGQRLRLTDPSGTGNCVLLAFHQRNLSERYNMPDSLKAQHTAHYTSGHCLFSDMGRVLLSFVEDDVGWHDPFGAIHDRESAQKQFGDRSYQEHRNKYVRNTRDNLIVELGKYGLDQRDWHAPLNLFSKVVVDDGPNSVAKDGSFVFVKEHRQPGQSVTLRAELDVLIFLSATPHRFDAEAEWPPQSLEADLIAGEPAGPDDPCRHHRPENERAYHLTDFAALAY